MSRKRVTGLVDKHGIKIREGDKIKWYDDIGTVKYGKGTFDGGYYKYIGFYIEYRDENNEIEHALTDGSGDVLFRSDEIEVIE